MNMTLKPFAYISMAIFTLIVLISTYQLTLHLVLNKKLRQYLLVMYLGEVILHTVFIAIVTLTWIWIINVG